MPVYLCEKKLKMISATTPILKFNNALVKLQNIYIKPSLETAYLGYLKNLQFKQ